MHNFAKSFLDYCFNPLLIKLDAEELNVEGLFVHGFVSCIFIYFSV